MRPLRRPPSIQSPVHQASLVGVVGLPDLHPARHRPPAGPSRTGVLAGSTCGPPSSAWSSVPLRAGPTRCRPCAVVGCENVSPPRTWLNCPTARRGRVVEVGLADGSVARWRLCTDSRSPTPGWTVSCGPQHPARGSRGPGDSDRLPTAGVVRRRVTVRCAAAIGVPAARRAAVTPTMASAGDGSDRCVVAVLALVLLAGSTSTSFESSASGASGHAPPVPHGRRRQRRLQASQTHPVGESSAGHGHAGAGTAVAGGRRLHCSPTRSSAMPRTGRCPQSSGFDVDDLTTLAYFSVDANADGTLDESGSGWNGYESQDLVNLVTRSHAAGDRVVLTVTCFSQSSLDAITSDPDRRRPLVGRPDRRGLRQEPRRRQLRLRG